MSIRFVKHSEIDKMKWDTCMRNSFNGLIYAYSWFLDIACDHWDALVEDDYKRIMPLPSRLKWKFQYVYQPHFTYQLGVFSIDKLTTETTEAFLSAIPKSFKTITYTLNKNNKVKTDKHALTVTPDLKLDLISPYKKLTSQYTQATVKRIEKATSHKLELRRSITRKQFIAFYKKHTNADDETLHQLNDLVETLTNLKIAETVGVYTSNNNLMSVAFFISYLNNVTLFAQATSPDGHKRFALHWLINSFIKSNAQKNVTLDFPEMTRLQERTIVKGFGSFSGEHIQVKANNLPIPFKYFFN